MKTLLGKKIGMTQIFTEEGLAVPVSVIEAGPEVVTQVKTVETDGYNAVQVGFENSKAHRVNKPMAGHFKKNELEAKKYLREFRVEEGEEYKVERLEDTSYDGVSSARAKVEVKYGGAYEGSSMDPLYGVTMAMGNNPNAAQIGRAHV